MVHWCRKVMNDETKRIVSALDTPNMDAFEVSGNVWGDLFRWKSYKYVWFPDFDLNYDVVPHQTFDIIFAEQVLEHVKYPYRCVRNAYRMLREGGYFLVTTPFLIQIHAVPGDYTRWTEEGLKYLFEECGFDLRNITTGSWGNLDCVLADLTACARGDDWNTYDPAKHSLAKDDNYPSVVWAVARKH